MKVVCINNSYSGFGVMFFKEGITVNKTYKVLGFSKSSNIPSTFYLIENDNGHEIEYSTEHFKELSDLRNDKLEELGI